MVLLKDLCKQFQLQINEPKENTRHGAKLDFLICGQGINVTYINQTSLISDHEIIQWSVGFKVTVKPQKLYIPNKKLAKEIITEASIVDPNVTNAIELLECFLLKRKLKKKKAFLKIVAKRIK